MATAAAAANLEQIIYLGGLGETESKLSHHLQSRTEVGTMLREGPVPVTILRAAMIIGSGSASFEILRYLVDRLPVMITPRWVATPCQPIGVRNVLHYLVGCLENRAVVGDTFDIGQPEVINYRQLMEVYAEEAGLPRRWIIPVPVLTPRLSSYWIHLVTPAPASLARPLAEGLSNPVVCQENRITALLPQELFDARQAIRLALGGNKAQNIETCGTNGEKIPPPEWIQSGDPAWAGGSDYRESRRVVLDGQPAAIWPAVCSLGAEAGYSSVSWLWKIRGFIDRVCGGDGLRGGRRSAAELVPGDSIDCWRVLAVEKPGSLTLTAEMKLPGEAFLCYRLKQLENGQTELQQITRFLPRGLCGILYWYAVKPFHHYVFNGMLHGIVKASGKTKTCDLEKF